MSVKVEFLTVFNATRLYAHPSKMLGMPNLKKTMGYFLDKRKAERVVFRKELEELMEKFKSDNDWCAYDYYKCYRNGLVEEKRVVKIKDKYFLSVNPNESIITTIGNFGKLHLISSSDQNFPKGNEIFVVKTNEDKIVIVGQRIKIQDLKGE